VVARGDAPARLGLRYRDPLNGFSLRPPAAAEVKKQPSGSKLITWSMRDPKTKAIAWSLTVQRAVADVQRIDPLSAYAKELVKTLRRAEKFQVESMKLAPAAGRPAIHLRGVTGGSITLWQRQVWIHVSPQRFLILTISGPVDRKQRLDGICQSVLETMVVHNPDEFIRAHRKQMVRGEDLLASLNHKTLTAALLRRRQWFLMKLRDRPVGWMAQDESTARSAGREGIEVKTWAKAQLPGAQPNFLLKTFFTTADRQLERWTEIRQTGRADRAFGRSEQGLKVADQVVVDFRTDRNSATLKKKVPPEIYLPKAMGAILPRLIDRRTPGAYTFAAYNGYKNDFDMRTVTVIGPEKIDWLSQKVDAVRLSDQAHYDEERADVWVDADGRLLRMKSVEGFVMEAVPRGAVLRRFPKAEQAIRDMDAAAKRTMGGGK
jgi:hypothetical protein